MRQTQYSNRSLIFGKRRTDLLVVASRNGQALTKPTGNLSFYYYDPTKRRPVWCLSFWFYRIFLSSNVPKEFRTLVTLTKILSVQGILATDAYKTLADAENYLGSVRLFWVQHGIFLGHFISNRAVAPSSRFSRITLFAISPHDTENYQRFGIVPGCIIPTGSLQNCAYLSEANQMLTRQSNRYDICLVLRTVQISEPGQLNQTIKQTIQTFLEDFNQYCKTRKPRVVVAISPNSSGSSHQENLQWMRRFLQHDFDVTDSGDQFATYRAIDSSNLTVGTHSTVLVEALSRGRKILSFNYSNLAFLDLPGAGLSHMNSPSYENLCERIDSLLPMSWETYWSKTPKELKDLTVDEPAEAISTINKVLRAELQGARDLH